MKTNTVAFAVL